MPAIKKGQNTPVEEINPTTNPVIRSMIDRYVIISGYCKGKDVMSLSCGVGYGEAILHALGAKSVVGVDMDEAAIQHISKTYHPHVKGVVGNFVEERIDLGKKFDVVISVETFEHIMKKDTKHLLDTMERHLKDDGTMIITTPRRAMYNWEYKGGTHLYEYCPEEFVNILQQKFPDKKIKLMLLSETRLDNDYVTFRTNDLRKCMIMVAIIK